MRKVFVPALLTVVILLSCGAPAKAYVPYESHVFFMESITRDILKLLPRAMGAYIFQNRYDFHRGMTFMARDVRANVHKKKDIEEIRKMAYERLMRDIPFVLEAMKGGEFKLDTHANNVAGRLGMIAYSIVLLKIPEFPDLLYYERFIQTLEEAVVEHLIDVNVIYDGYGDFKCLGELMERFKKDETPTLVHMRNDVYAAGMKEEMYSMFRPPDKFKINITFTNVDMNRVYGNMLNDICDAYLFIWKCSGMELQHASYAAPPGTLLTRLRRGSVGQSAGVLAKPIVPTGQPFATSIQRPADSSWTPPRNTYAPQQQP